MFIYFWEREAEHEWGRGKERGDTEYEAGSRLWVVSTEPEAGLKPTSHEIMTWAEVRCLTNWATQVSLRQNLGWEDVSFIYITIQKLSWEKWFLICFQRNHSLYLIFDHPYSHPPYLILPKTSERLQKWL